MWQVIGQDKILALLDRSLKEANIAHAYLLIGPPHVGKRTLALNFAQALNCDGLNPPCGQCRSCHRILEGKHADVTSTSLDSRVEIGIDDIRGLQRLANLPPYESKCKVFIIDGAEYLSTEAANSLLKILEEPPPKVVWFLLAVEKQRLLPTIISRCQQLELKPMPLEQIQRVLIDSYNIDFNKAKFLAHLSHGCLGWALSALMDDSVLKQRAQRVNKLSALSTASLEERFSYAQELTTQFTQDRRSVAEIMETWLSWWRDLMLIKSSCKEAITNIDYEASLGKQAEMLNLSQIKEFLANLCLIREGISRNANSRLAFELLMLNMPKGEIIDG